MISVKCSNIESLRLVAKIWTLWYHVCFVLPQWVLLNFRNSSDTVFILCEMLLLFIACMFICRIQTLLNYLMLECMHLDVRTLSVRWRIWPITCTPIGHCWTRKLRSSSWKYNKLICKYSMSLKPWDEWLPRSLFCF